MKKSILLIIISLLLIVGCSKKEEDKKEPIPNENNKSVYQVYDMKRDSAKIADVKIVYSETEEIKFPAQIRKFIHKGFRTDLLNRKIAKGKLGKEDDKLYFPNSDEYLTVKAYNYTASENVYRNCTIVKIVNTSKYLQINGIIPNKTTYNQVLETLGKDNASRDDDFDTELAKGKIELEYISDESYENTPTLIYEYLTYNRIKLNISINEEGIVSKVKLTWI